jgi:mannose-6-phosphate isomerase
MKTHDLPKIVKKPWGFESIWALTLDYVGKMLHINEGHRLSRQKHLEKEETIQVLLGVLTLEVGIPGQDGHQKLKLSPGDTFHIEPGLIHRFCAYDTDVKICEVSTPHLDDVVRLSDDYKR